MQNKLSLHRNHSQNYFKFIIKGVEQHNFGLVSMPEDICSYKMELEANWIPDEDTLIDFCDFFALSGESGHIKVFYTKPSPPNPPSKHKVFTVKHGKLYEYGVLQTPKKQRFKDNKDRLQIIKDMSYEDLKILFKTDQIV